MSYERVKFNIIKRIICDVNMDLYQAKFMKIFITKLFLAT